MTVELIDHNAVLVLFLNLKIQVMRYSRLIEGIFT